MNIKEIDEEIEKKEKLIIVLQEEIKNLKKEKVEMVLSGKFPMGRDVMYLGDRYKIEGYGIEEWNILYMRKYKKGGDLSIKISEVYGSQLESVFLLENKGGEN